MKRLISFLTASAVTLFLSVVPVLAQHGGGGGGGGAGHAGGAGQGAGMSQGSGTGAGSSQGRGAEMGRAGDLSGSNQSRNNTAMGSAKTTGDLLTQNTKLSSKSPVPAPQGNRHARSLEWLQKSGRVRIRRPCFEKPGHSFCRPEGKVEQWRQAGQGHSRTQAGSGRQSGSQEGEKPGKERSQGIQLVIQTAAA